LTGAITIDRDGGRLLFQGRRRGPQRAGGERLFRRRLGTDNSGTQNLTDRLNDDVELRMFGGQFHFVGAAGAASSETLGVASLEDNQASRLISNPGAGGSAQ